MDDIPPRYEQVGGWKHLVTDEREWLARPAAWGIGELPEPARERKQALYDHHFYPRLAAYLTCDVCRPLVVAQFGEDGPRVPDGVPLDREAFRAWHGSQHAREWCDGRSLARLPSFYERGVITRVEWRNKLIDNSFEAADRAARGDPAVWQLRAEWERALALELVGQNPFRPVVFDPSWRTETVVALARGMYEARDFGPMPVLADALEDAGCDQPDVVGHCRDRRIAHIRGCWVVDGVLGLS